MTITFNSTNSSLLLGLFGGSSGALDVTTLAVTAKNPLDSTAVKAATQAPIPPAPWNNTETAQQASTNVQNALAGHNIIGASTVFSSATIATGNPTADAKTVAYNQDYQKLFNLYQGLSTLQDLATRAQTKNLAAVDQTELARAFSAGLSQVSDFVDATKFTNLRLTLGTDVSSSSSSLKISTGDTSYESPPLANTLTDDVSALDGNVVFNIAVKRSNQTINVPIDLSNLGGQPRSLANVIGYINTQLAAAGVDTRFASNRFPGQAQTVNVAGKAVTVAPAQDRYGYKVNVSVGETVTFSAPQTAGAIYMAQTVGDPNPDKDPTTNDGVTNAQLAKFQTDTNQVAAPPQIAGQPNFVDGRVFAQNLDPDVTTVRSTQVAADGSVYMLADVKGNVNGQAISGTQDVALLKYDSAGHLMYTRTLGASGSASGLSLAVSANGQVAVAGALTGDLLGATEGALNSGATGAFAQNTDSFVTLYDASGQELWTERRGARLNDEATQLAFSADGATVYVAGRAQGQMPAAGAPIGDYDGYIEAFTTDASGNPKATFTQNFGTTGADKPQGMVVNGNNLITASVENGHAVLRSFDVSSGQPVLSATRDLGDLQGGSIAGLSMAGGQLVVAGTTSNGALSAGTVKNAASGGSDAFVAQISADLSSQPSDAIAYYGGAGDDRATSLAVSGSQVFIAGVAGTDLPGQPAVGKQDGFLASIDMSTGQATWSRRFTGKDGVDAPTAIAAAPTGASVLDRLGLPSGTLTTTDSQQLVAQSSLRPGEQFTVKASGLAKTITIDPGETYDTLVQKINRASGFGATASVFHNLDGTIQLKIVPTYGEITVELGPGPQGKDALQTLGLAEGAINLTQVVNGKVVPADGRSKIYGLGLSRNLNLNDATQITHALAQVAASMGVVRTAYRELSTAENPPLPNAGNANGSVPTYMTDQLANLQAGLARLTGGASLLA